MVRRAAVLQWRYLPSGALATYLGLCLVCHRLLSQVALLFAAMFLMFVLNLRVVFLV